MFCIYIFITFDKCFLVAGYLDKAISDFTKAANKFHASLSKVDNAKYEYNYSVANVLLERMAIGPRRLPAT